MVVMGVLLYGLFGFKKGMIKMFSEFLALIITIVVTIIVYKLTNNPLIALGVFLVLGLIVSMQVRAFLLKKEESGGTNFTLVSRLGGLLLGIFWAIITACIFFIAVGLLPRSLPFVEEASGMLGGSAIYKNVIANYLNRSPFLAKFEYIAKISENKESLAKLKDSQEFNAILENDKIKAILEDGALLKYIEEKDFSKVLTNPKVVALLQDGRILEQFVNMDVKKIVEENN